MNRDYLCGFSWMIPWYFKRRSLLIWGKGQLWVQKDYLWIFLRPQIINGQPLRIMHEPHKDTPWVVYLNRLSWQMLSVNYSEDREINVGEYMFNKGRTGSRCGSKPAWNWRQKSTHPHLVFTMVTLLQCKTLQCRKEISFGTFKGISLGYVTDVHTVHSEKRGS